MGAGLAAALAVSFGAAYLGWRIVEQPSQHLARRLFPAPRAEADSPAGAT
jgi:peptidoglycan/LPS O-acetylase OafA/YrhL